MSLTERSLVSIVIVTYNQEKFIETAITSALNQSYKNIQLIITDDKSKDQTFSIAREIVSGNDRVILIQNDKNIGITANHNQGLKKVAGQFIIFMGGDDVLDKNCVEEHLKEFKLNDSLMLHYFNARIIDENGMETGQTFNNFKNKGESGNGKLLIKRGTINCACATMIRNNRIWFNTETGESSDWLFWIENALLGEIKFSDLNRVSYRKHTKSYSYRFNWLKEINHRFKTLRQVYYLYPKYRILAVLTFFKYLLINFLVRVKKCVV